MTQAPEPDGSTQRIDRADEESSLEVPSFEVWIDGNGRPFAAERVTFGSHAQNDVVLSDATVSRAHAVIEARGGRLVLLDRGSVNGTFVDGVEVREAMLGPEHRLRFGRAEVVVRQRAGRVAVPTSQQTQFGTLVGRSARTRALFALLDRVARSDSTVLIEGETGTGKEAIAESIHRASDRRDAPFVVVDCGSLPHDLVESELFGHERGAFTGASQRRRGAFEAAHGGTLFLDEIGELPLELQPKLLRALEQRSVRRVGSNERVDVDLRILAATHRRLDGEVNAGRFRADLFFRLAVVRVEVPSLAERIEDVPLLVTALLDQLRADPATRARLQQPAFLARLAGAHWPGNVRQLRNVLERYVVLGDTAELLDEMPTAAVGEPRGPSRVDANVSYAVARERALLDFERAYVEALLALHDGNVSKAAREAGLDRAYLHRLIRRARRG